MKTQKTLNVDSELISKLEAKFPDAPFTKLVDRGLRLLLDPNIANKKVNLDDSTMEKFERLCKRVYELHNHVIE
jgi:hypothetical protein